MQTAPGQELRRYKVPRAPPAMPSSPSGPYQPPLAALLDDRAGQGYSIGSGCSPMQIRQPLARGLKFVHLWPKGHFAAQGGQCLLTAAPALDRQNTAVARNAG